MKTVTKIVYLVLLAVLVVVPSVRWALDPSIDMAGFGAFAAGIGVPMGTLTVAMASVGIAKRRNDNGTHD